MTEQESWRSVGSKIRHLRKSNGLTLKQLARGCDLSANTISLVERSEVAPNIDTLCKIATALGVSPSSLFLEVCKPRVVLQRADGPGEEMDLPGRTTQVLATVSQGAGCSCLPSAQKGTAPDSLPDRRHSILCLCGQVELEIDGQTYCLNPGDSLAFNCDAFHRWRNTGILTGIATLILPPTSFQDIQTGN